MDAGLLPVKPKKRPPNPALFLIISSDNKHTHTHTHTQSLLSALASVDGDILTLTEGPYKRNENQGVLSKVHIELTDLYLLIVSKGRKKGACVWVK